MNANLISPKGKSMTCKFPAVHLQQQHKAMSGWKYPQRGSEPPHGITEEGGSRRAAHANIIYKQCMPPQSLSACMQKMNAH